MLIHPANADFTFGWRRYHMIIALMAKDIIAPKAPKIKEIKERMTTSDAPIKTKILAQLFNFHNPTPRTIHTAPKIKATGTKIIRMLDIIRDIR